MPEFIKPTFNNSDLEIRDDDGLICIYCTSNGLKQLVKLCNKLIDNPKIGHIHLEDYIQLSEKSLNGVIAVFDNDK